MLRVSKGDVFIEPLELLIEFVLRVFGKALGRGAPTEPVEQWGFAEWLWMAVFLGLVSLVVWAVFRWLKRRA